MAKLRAGLTLTDKEKMFCEEYIIDLHATHAAIRAGYSEESATTTGYHLKQKPEVDAWINKLLEDRQLRLRLNPDDVLMELAKIAFAEVVDVLGDDTAEEMERKNKAEQNTNLANKPNLSEPDRKMMACINDKHKANKPSEKACTGASSCRVIYTDSFSGRRTIVHFSLSCKIAALKLLAKHFGLFVKDTKGAMPAPNIIFPRMEYVPNVSNSGLKG